MLVNNTFLRGNFSYEQVCDISNISTVENIFYIMFMLSMLTACIVGNGLVIVATVVSHKLKSSVTVRFIASLACSDLLLGCVFIPSAISSKIYKTMFCSSRAFCFAFMVIDVTCTVSSMLNLLLIAIDRFVAINFPLSYVTLLPLKTAKKLIAGVWIFSLTWPITGIFNWKRKTTSDPILSITTMSFSCRNDNMLFYDITYFGVYLLCLLAMTCLYLKILHIALQQIKSIEATQASLQLVDKYEGDFKKVANQNEELELINIKESTSNAREKKKLHHKKTRRELKATKSVAIVYFAFLMCWFPNFVLFLIISKKDASYFRKVKQRNQTLFYFIYYLFTQILPSVNVMLNPIIYSFSNRHFRKGFKDVIKQIVNKCTFKNDDFLPRLSPMTERSYTL